MEIYDDEYHAINIRDNFKYDFIIVVDGKTPKEIFNEIKEKIEI